MKTMTAMIGILAVLLLVNCEKSMAQQPGDKVYWMATVEVPIGKLPEYHAMNEKEQVPLMEKHGYKFVAVWQTIVGDIEEIIVIAEFENMAAYHKARRSLLGSAEWQTLSKKFDGLTRSVQSRFLSATPYSKLK